MAEGEFQLLHELLYMIEPHINAKAEEWFISQIKFDPFCLRSESLSLGWSPTQSKPRRIAIPGASKRGQTWSKRFIMIKRQETKRATTSASIQPRAQALNQPDWVKKIEGQAAQQFKTTAACNFINRKQPISGYSTISNGVDRVLILKLLKQREGSQNRESKATTHRWEYDSTLSEQCAQWRYHMAQCW